MSKDITPPSIFLDSVNNKLVSQKESPEKKSATSISLDEANLNNISNNSITSITNNESVLELFPDINLTIDIITSSIISPKDLLSSALNYSLEDSFLSISTSHQILTTVEEHVNKFYKLKDNLETIVRESLFTKGSYIEAIIPSSFLTKLTNEGTTVGIENYVDGYMSNSGVFNSNKIKTLPKKEVGKFKSTVGLLEDAIDVNSLITVTDNTKILNAPKTYRDGIKKNILKKLTVGLEEDVPDQNEEVAIEVAFRKLKADLNRPIINIDTQDEALLAKESLPLVMKLPTESVIPVHVIGDPSNHLGYFVMLDKNGSPLTAGSDWFASSDSDVVDLYKNTILSKTNRELNKRINKVPMLQNADEIYNDVIDRRIKNIIDTSDDLKDIADVTMVNHVYRVMMLRILKNQKTRLLFIPAELVQFYAFEYRANGTGMSLLEKISVLSSIRAILMFGKMMSTIKNSIPTVKMTVDLDDKDPDPARTKERVIAETLKNKQLELPVGILNIHDLTQWVHKVGYFYEFNHPDLPNIKIDISDVNRSIQEPDEGLEEDIRNRILMTLGITPEMVEAGVDIDFAAVQITNNALFARRIQKRQNTLNMGLTNHVKIIIKNDGVLFDKIKDIVKQQLPDIKKDLKKVTDVELNDELIIKYILRDTSENLKISLPTVEATSEDSLQEAFSNYKDKLEDAIESVLGDEAITEELAVELGGKVSEFRNMVYHTLLRKWMRNNNYLPELNELVTFDEEGKIEFSLMEEYEQYIKDIILGLKPVLKDSKKVKKLISKIFDKYESEEEEEEIPVDNGEEETPADDNTEESGSGSGESESGSGDGTTEEGNDNPDEAPEDF